MTATNPAALAAGAVLSRRLAGGLLVAVLVILACDPSRASAVELRLIGMRILPRAGEFRNTVVGGLSGLDYDGPTDRWLAVSDDKSEHGPARAYLLRLDYDAQQFSSVAVEDMIVLRQPDGSAYPDRAAHAARGGELPDLESLRLDPADGTLWYSSEGDRPLGMQPFVRHATRDGKYLGELALPDSFRFSRDAEVGLRPNLGIEGLSFAPDGGSLWVVIEAPRFEDGPVPTPGRGAATRFTRFTRDGRELEQFAYPLNPIPATPADGKFADNGVSEVLATADGLLVLERAGVQCAGGGYRFHVRLYAAGTDGATDVRAITALAEADFRPMSKRLLVDFNRFLPDGVDNLEGMSWGRRLPNGHATLVLVSDDNFNPAQSTQLWVFEVLPKTGAASAPKPVRQWDDFFDGVVQDEHRIAGFVGDYRWLSNYYPCPVTYEGRTYGSSEAAYHASKYPAAERDEFTKLDPDAAKKLSRKKGVDQKWWDERKARVMTEILQAKFAQNPGLAGWLLATGDRHLEETNWWGDKFWGVAHGAGRNELGRILMEIRSHLRADRP